MITTRISEITIMKKIIVIGCPGSGKSTFSRQLQEIWGIPLFHLDMLNWNADRTTVTKELFHKRLNDILKEESWIIDGNYGSTMEKRLQHCDTVYFLDYPTETCLLGMYERRGKARTDIPWVEGVDDIDEDFISFIKDYNIVSRPKVLELLSLYASKNIHIFKNRDEANDYLSQLQFSF